MLLIFLAPAIEAGPRNPKVTACFCYVSVRLCVIEDPLATLGFPTPSIHRDTSWPASSEARSVSPIRTFLHIKEKTEGRVAKIDHSVRF